MRFLIIDGWDLVYQEKWIIKNKVIDKCNWWIYWDIIRCDN